MRNHKAPPFACRKGWATHEYPKLLRGDCNQWYHQRAENGNQKRLRKGEPPAQMRNLISSALIIVALFAGMSLSKPAAETVSLGVVECEAVWSSRISRPPHDHAPGIIVRLFSKDGKRETFAFSDGRGLAFVPLRPGDYCVQAFDKDGSQMELDTQQVNCFNVKKNESPTIGVVLMWPQKK